MARPRRRSGFSGDGVSITELARRLGVTVRTLRYYEEAGLLTPQRTPGNARVYGPQARAQAAWVVTAAELGLGRDAIRDMLVVGEPRASRLLAARLREGLKALDARRARLVQALEDLGPGQENEDLRDAAAGDDQQDAVELSAR